LLATSCLGSAEDLTDLLEVIGVVAGHVRGKISDCDPATFGMYAKAFPLLGRQLM
jgi:hypothetical protein